MIAKVELTIEELEATKTFQNASKMVQDIYRMPLYIKAVSGWVTVAKYKGLQHMLNAYHMNDFKRQLVTELFESKVKVN